MTFPRLLPILLVAFFPLIVIESVAMAGSCSGIPLHPAYPAIDRTAFERLYRDVVERDFPELKGIRIEIREFQSDSDYLRADVERWTLFRPASERNYVLWVNPRLLASPPGPAALEAILVHETSHLRDYTRMSAIGLVGFGLRYLFFPIAPYERKTDETALQKGLGCGLMEYRNWLYDHESGAALEDKKRDYYTPSEIAEWMGHHTAP